MPAAAIYARYSSDRQSERSIDDQIRLCRDFIAGKEDRATADAAITFTDYAISGATRDRPGLLALLQAVREGRVSRLYSEALDRISRDQEDIAALYKRMAFHSVPIITVGEGEISELHIGLKGTMNALFLKDLAAKTRRGIAGKAMAGLIPGAIVYGYDVKKGFDANGEPLRGHREINERQAEIVRRIFAEYIAGDSARTIAKRLNRDGIASPRGGVWNASTIIGNRARASGILQNEIYAGRYFIGRQTFIKDPGTGRRIPRLNPREKWQAVDMPALRIIDDETWRAAARKLARYGGARPEMARRPQRLLSGLLRCGCCGGSITITTVNGYACSNHRQNGGCGMNRIIKPEILEDRVFSGLKERLLHPDVVAEFVRTYHAERAEAQKAERHRLDVIARELRDAKTKIDRIVTAITDGIDTPEMRVKLRELSAARTALEDEREGLAGTEAVTLHPNAADIYRRQIDGLREALNAEATRPHAVALLRDVIEKIILTPKAGRGEWNIEMHGHLARLLLAPEAGSEMPVRKSAAVKVQV